MSIHPYNNHSKIYNFFFHPLHQEENKTTALIANIALTVLTGFLWQIPFWIVNRFDNRKLEQWNANNSPSPTTATNRVGTETLDLPKNEAVAHKDWKGEIQSTPHFVESNSPEGLVKNYMSLVTHQHEIIDGIYLGDYRAFLSTDPSFLKKHDLVDSKVDTVESLMQCGATRVDAERHYAQLASDTGCSKLGIGLVISVTQFQPRDEVPTDDWSRFKPNLDGLGIDRVQVRVDDDGFAWEGIKPHLDEIFSQIDEARAQGKKILIHCVKGASRSSTVMIAYLMNRYRVSYDQAFNYVKSKRTQIEAKPSLTEGLRTYQAELGIKE